MKIRCMKCGAAKQFEKKMHFTIDYVTFYLGISTRYRISCNKIHLILLKMGLNGALILGDYWENKSVSANRIVKNEIIRAECAT